MLRVVCDTNIYISAYNFGGMPKRIFELAIARNIQLYVSPPILEEIKRILREKFQWPDISVQELLTNIQDFTKLVTPRSIIEVVTRDTTDNRILECAVAAGANSIVSGDDDLLSLKNYKGISILTPRQFLDGLGLRKAA